jgi:hypothetical protein
MQGAFMDHKLPFSANITIDSVLEVKSSGSINDEVSQDLNLENGKSIAQLIYDSEKTDLTK